MPEPDILARVDLFAGLTAADRARLAASLRGRRYAKAALIFLRDDPGTGLYVIERGWVKLVLTSAEGKEFVLDVLGPGACFGELALLDGEPRSADAVALEDCRLLFLRRADFDALLGERPQVARALLGVLGRRLRRDAELLAEAVFLDLPARLARVLVQLAETQRPAAGEHELRVTQEELGGMLGTSRESVNKWLGYLERRGVLRRQRGGITLLRPEALARRPE